MELHGHSITSLAETLLESPQIPLTEIETAWTHV